MSYKVLSIPLFDKQTKRLVKKYPTIKKGLSILIDSLELLPTQGASLGNNFYKIRLANRAKSKGKSGGARIITYVKIVETTVYLSSIYEKGEKDSITQKELEDIFKSIG